MYYGDFICFYDTGKILLKKPNAIYDNTGYFYTPFFLLLLSLTICNFDTETAYNIYFLMNLTVGICCIIEFDKILVIKDLNIKQRIQFLLIFNGNFIWIQFYNNQSKFFLLFCLLHIIVRELKIKKEKKDFKYHLINGIYWSVIIGLAPYLIFLIIIYFFHIIKTNDLYKKIIFNFNFGIGLNFIIQNFLFILYPKLIFKFLFHGFFKNETRMIHFYYLFNKDLRLIIYNFPFFNVYILILWFISILLIILSNISLEDKSSWFFLSYLVFGLFTQQHQLLIIIFLFISLFLMKDIKMKNKKANLILFNIILFGFFPYYNISSFSFINHIYILSNLKFKIYEQINKIIIIILYTTFFYQIIKLKRKKTLNFLF